MPATGKRVPTPIALPASTGMRDAVPFDQRPPHEQPVPMCYGPPWGVTEGPSGDGKPAEQGTIMDRDRFMRRAFALAETNVVNGAGGPFGALIVHDGQIIGEGTNLVTTSHDPTAHAEIVAIRTACTALGTFRLAGCDIYSSCEPCPMCLSALYWAHIDRIFYGNSRSDAAAIGFDDDHIYREIALPLPERTIPMTRLHRDEALQAFLAWERAGGKIAY